MKTVRYTIKLMPPEIMTDYDGWNYSAATEIGFYSYPIKPNQILLNNTMPFYNPKDKLGDNLIRTAIHEIAEDQKMKELSKRSYRSKNYWTSHLHAEKVERKQENINAMIKAMSKLFEKSEYERNS